MADISTAELISALSKIQHNYTSLATYWYDIFYNPEPKVVSMDFYDAEGEKIVITIDNLAKIKERTAGITGEGAPDPSLTAEFGTIYHDTLDGRLYRFAKDYTSIDESAGYWDMLITAEMLDSIIIRDDDPINNKVKPLEGVLYLSRDTHRLYMGRHGAWERIDAAPSSVVQDNFKVASNDPLLVSEGIILSTACENKSSMTVYVDGVLLGPDKYTINGNGFILKFKEPLLSPEKGKSIDINVRYYTNLCIYEDYWEEGEDVLEDGTVVTRKQFKFAKELFESLESLTTRLNELIAEAADMRRDTDQLEVDLAKLKEDLENAVAITVGDLTKEVKVIVENVKSERSTVQSLHESVKTWYDQVSSIRNEVNGTKADIAENVAWLRDLFTDPDTGKLDLKRFVFVDDFTKAMETQQEDYVNRIANTRTELATVINNNSNKINALEISVSENANHIVENADSIAKLNEELVNTEARIKKTCFSEFNYPIDFFSTVKNNRVVYDAVRDYYVADDEGRETLCSDIGIRLARDFSYYTIDLTEDLAAYGGNKIYKGFFLTNSVYRDEVIATDFNVHASFIGTTGSIYDVDLEGATLNGTTKDGDFTLTFIDYDPSNPVRGDFSSYSVGDVFNIDEFEEYSLEITGITVPEGITTDDTYFIQARVLLKNASEYRPRIVWSASNISWFGGEEPDFEASRTYLLEFVSYDFGKTWFAHTLGICQPSIDVGTLSVMLDITLENYNATDLGVMCDVFYNKGELAEKDEDDDSGEDEELPETFYAGTYPIDNGGVIRDVELIFNKSELGDLFNSVRIHKATDRLFEYHPVILDNYVVDDEIISRDGICNNLVTEVGTHYYAVEIVSDNFNKDDTFEVSLVLSKGGKDVTVNLVNPERDEDGNIIGEDDFEPIQFADDVLTVAVISDDNMNVFEGANEVSKTTPWILKSATVTATSKPEDSESAPNVTIYKGAVDTTLKLDGISIIYVE